MKNLFFLIVLISNSLIANKKSAFELVDNYHYLIEDSLEIEIKNIPAKTITAFNYSNNNLDTNNILFENKTSDAKNVVKKILKPKKNDYSLIYRTSSFINNKNVIFYHNYQIQQSCNRIEFIFDDKTGDVQLINYDGKIILYDDIYNAYNEITNKSNQFSNQQKIQKIEKLHEEFQSKFDSSDKQALNDLFFYTKLSFLQSKDARIKNYLESDLKMMLNSELSFLIYNYLETNKDEIYLMKLNQTSNVELNRFYEIVMFNHLKQYKDQKYLNYDKNLTWYKSTSYYIGNKEFIDEALENKKDFDKIQKSLLSLAVYNQNKIDRIENILLNNSSQFYLFDFWATWCIPCLENIKATHKIKLPSNVKVIYISLDRTKDKEKWRLKSNNLDIKNSYLFVENVKNKNIIEVLNLHKIPRYILINEKFEIINPSFIFPQDANFSDELNKIVK